MKKQFQFWRFAANKKLKYITIFLLISMLFLFLYAQSVLRGGKQVQACLHYETYRQAGRLCTLSLERVDSDASREIGLSGQSSMAPNKGMLFVFDHIGTQCMWMKGMRFPLDIAWLNSRGDVIKLEEKVATSTYPQQFCSVNTLFVIEVNAGFAKANNLSVGSHVSL